MENKDQNSAPVLGVEESNGTPSTAGFNSGGVHAPPPDMDALSLDPESGLPLTSQEQHPPNQPNLFRRLTRRLNLIFIILLVLGGAGLFFTLNREKDEQGNVADTANQFDTVKLPLDDLVAGKSLTLAGAANVTINGPMQLNDALLLTPSLQPTGAKRGQIYYDQGTNQLAYYNGEVFVFLTGPQIQEGGVQSLGGATGQLTLGSGLTLANGQLASAGVLSVQGESGNVNLTAGPGIIINGTNFSNSGVIDIAAGSPNVTVDRDSSGNVTISVAEPTAGTGTVTSSGGTAGTIPVFTGSQNIEDSIITQSGLTVTISGDLSVVTGGLTLSNPLTVSNGGTGATSLATNGVLIGQGTAAVTAVASGGAGLCLVSTAGAPTWAACPGGGGVSSLNGLTGALSIANASAAGSTVTIDNASTSAKGIASFNGTNFTVTGGAVNTTQDINTTATPTFAGVNTNTITPSAALTVGVSAQTALLQGSTTTITSNGAGNNIVLNSAGTIELQDNTNITGDMITSGDITVNGGDITSAGSLTVGVASQTLTLQGGAATSFRASSGGNTTIVAFTNPTANTTLNFPALAAGTYTICTTSGNCSGASTTLQSAYDNSSDPEFVLDATRGALTIRDNSTPLGANLLEVQNNAGSATYLAVTSSGIAVTGTATVSGNVNSSSGSIQTNGITRIDNSGNGINLGSLTLSGAISGGTTVTSSGDIDSTGGGLQTNSVTRIDNSGNLINIGSVTTSGNAIFQGGSATLGTNSQAGTIVLNDGSSNTGTIQLAALGQNTVYTLSDPGAGTATICLSTGNCAGSGGGVTTGGGTTNRLAKFTGTQAIGDSSISDDGTNVTVSIDVIIQGGDLTLGSASQNASIVLNDGNGQTTTLQAGNSTGDITFILPTNTGTANQCLKQSGTGNQLVWQDCDGGAGGSSATLQMAYNNSVNPEITLNSSVGGLTIRDDSTPLGTNLFEIQNNAGSTTYLAVTVSGLSVTGTATATGNINSSGGAIQTNGTTRIDNSGNMVSIGNITGSGAITIASIGAGNDITIDGTDEFIVQDGAVFNALSTFNSNIDLGGNDIIGTTTDINLTNFDVVGATGNVTAGTYNGQTISSSANFTGTVAVAGNVTLTSDIAVNGGDLTSSGALNITPGGTLTIGATGQQLILQGSANTQLTATGGGFTTTVGFAGTPSGAVTYNFDRAAATGTYTICTTIGNCAGAGGGVTTSGGTTGALAKFTGAQTLGDSLLSESGSVVTVNGNLNLTSGNEFRVDGTQISSANLSNDANLAKLNASQTFTGNTIAFQNGTNSTNAFNVQNAAGNRVVTVDTSNAQVILGMGSVLDGALVFSNVTNNNTVTIVPGTPTANRTLTLPDASGTICTNSGNCAGAGATLQTAYNFSVGGTTPKIKVNSSLGGVDIQDADTPIGANLFNVRASNGSGLGSVMFGIGNTGQVTLQNTTNSTTAFRLLTQGGTSVLTGDTTNGQILLGQSGTLSGLVIFNNSTNSNTISLGAAAATANRSILLPDASGTICLDSGNCSGAGSTNTLQAAYDAGNTITTTTARDISFALADTATDGNFFVDLQCDTSCGANGRFAIQDDGTDVMTVSPAGGSVLFRNSANSTTAFRVQNATGAVTVFTLDTANILARISGAGSDASLTSGTGAMQIGDDAGANMAFDDNEIIARNNGSTSTLFLQNGGGGLSVGANLVTFQNAADSNNAFIVRNAAGTAVALVDTTDGELELGSSSTLTGTLLFRNSTNSFVTILRPTAPAAHRTILLPDADGTICLQSSASCGFVTGSTTDYIQNQNASSQTANFRISGTGRIDTALVSPIIRPITDSATAIQLQNAAGTTTVFNVDTSNSRVGIGTSAPGTTLEVAGNAGLFRMTGDGGVNTHAYMELYAGGSAGGRYGYFGYASGATNDLSLMNQRNGTIVLGTNNTSRVIITSGGNVGIGANTTYKLDVDGDVNITSASAYKINGTNVCTSSGCTPAAGSGNYIQNGTSPQTADFNVTGTAKVGSLVNIGSQTTGTGLVVGSQTATLTSLGSDVGIDVYGSVNAPTIGLNIINTNTGTSAGSAQQFIVVDSAGTAKRAATIEVKKDSNTWSSGDATTQDAAMTFLTTVNGAQAERMRIGSNGNVGIGGVTNPTRTLQVNGTGYVSGDFELGNGLAFNTLSGNPRIFSLSTTQYQSNAATLQHRITNQAGTDLTGTLLQVDTNGSTLAAGTKILNVRGDANIDALTVLSSGNVGVGVANPTHRLEVAGDASISADSTTAFQVLNASAVPLFVIDTSATRAYVGNPTADTTGALLVLDNKTNAGDPTGTNGAMYYSQALNAFRCYEVDAWRNCSDPRTLNWGYRIEEEFMGANEGTGLMGQHGWTDWNTGTGAFTAKTPADTYTRPGQHQLFTGTSTNGSATLYLGTNFGTNEQFVVGGGEYIEFAVNIPTLATATQDYILRLGLCDTDGGVDCDDGVYFEYSRATSANWRYVTASNATRTKTTSTKAVATGWVNFRILINGSGGTPSSASFFVRNNGETTWTSLGAAATTNIPSGSARSTSASFAIVKTAGTTGRTLNVDYFNMYNSLSSGR